MSIYERMGGSAAIERLVDALYAEMEREPGVSPLLALHEDVPRAKERLFEFLSGWTGGPPLYVRKHGHPRLRARHLHVPIDEVMVGMWMHCMNHALHETVTDEEVRQILRSNLEPLAHHLRNQE